MREDQQDPKTPSRLRRDIDAGEGRDKIAYPDPAAAPLGTDDEAAGTPVSERQAQLAYRNEILDRSERDMEAKNDRAVSEQRAAVKPRLGLSVMGLALLVVILLAVSAFA